jgi:hypothetical protein
VNPAKVLLAALEQVCGAYPDTAEGRIQARDRRDQLLTLLCDALPLPVYPHDCPDCTFIGHVVHKHDGLCDVYECAVSVTLGTSIIARYGSLGSEYASMNERVLESAHAPESALIQALALVKARREWLAHLGEPKDARA